MLVLLALNACKSGDCNCEDPNLQAVNPDEIAQIDMSEIKEKGTLRALTTYSSTSYFIYRGQAMGYEYELLERLADFLDVELELVVADDLDSMFYQLNNGEVDIIAHGLTITNERKQWVDFTEPHITTRQVLVQRKPENWRKLSRRKVEKSLVRNPADLIGKKVHVRNNTSYQKRLKNLSDEIGGDINIEGVPGYLTTEELIKKVAFGEYEYTVADQNIANINNTYYPQLDIKTPVSFPTRIAWAVRKSSPELLTEVNKWIALMKKKPDYYVIYNKYFKNQKDFQKRVKSEFYSLTGGKISQYDEMIQDYAEELQWDWRLLASQIYQESRFRPDAQSWAGARGLMQVMPATARQFGISELYDPTNSMKAGTAYLEYLQGYWKSIPDSTERVKFILASYNAGPGHVEDARRLADKYGKNPYLWDKNVAEYLLLKSKPLYYNDPVVYYGYCRGTEPYKYVKDIVKRFEHYSRFIEEGTIPEQLALN